MGEQRGRPLIVATVVMVAAVFVVTGRIIGFDRAMHLISGPGVGDTWFDNPVYTSAESAVVLVLVFAHAWRTPVLVAVPSVVALVLVAEHAAFYRPHISLSRADAVQLMLILSIIMAAGGLLLRNVMAAGHATLTVNGEDVEVTAPRVVSEAEAFAALAEGVKRPPKSLRIKEFLRMDVA